MRSRLKVLRADIAADRAAFDSQLHELHALDLKHAPPRGDLALVAIALHNAYSAVENILLRVARAIDDSVPEGPDWHQQLLRVMSLDVEGLRPAVVSRESLEGLRKLLDFRHFFRHGSVAIPLDARRLMELQAVALDMEPVLTADLDRLDALLVGLIEAAD